jgi:type II secretory pathway component PulK
MKEKGSVLIAVLWVTLLLIIFSSGIAVTSLTEYAVHRMTIDQLQARYLADAAFEELKMYINKYPLIPPDERPATLEEYLSNEGIIYTERKIENAMPDGRQGLVMITLIDESNKFNINRIDKPLLQILLQKFEAEDPEGISENIISWRRNKRPFINIPELGVVKEIDVAIIEKIAPYLTVYTPNTLININTCDDVVLEIMERYLNELNIEFSANAAKENRPFDPQKLREFGNGQLERFFTTSPTLYKIEIKVTIGKKICILNIYSTTLANLNSPIAYERVYKKL